MKTTIVLSLSILALAACNNAKNNTSENDTQKTATEQTALGGEKDNHGCLVAAGETWSELKQNCIQIFSVGQRLNPIVVAKGEATISAFVLFNEEQSKAEVFLPNKEKSTVLDKVSDGVFQNEALKFETKDHTLSIDNMKKYQGK